jgi:hypothetical protein
MKKTLNVFAILALVTFGIFTSCTEDIVDPAEKNPPTISITQPGTDSTTVFVGDSVNFEVSLNSDNGLKSLSVLSSASGVVITNGDVTFSGTSFETVTVNVKITNAVAAGTIVVLSFVVDDSEKSASTTKYIFTKAKLTPLSEAKSFEWIRAGGTPATGLEKFGLTWTSNSADLNAVIKKGATKFVELVPNDWTAITNIEGLKSAIDAATDMDKWEKVSAASASKTYSLTLGTIKEGTYYLIHVTNSTASVSDIGTTVTVIGQYKE